MANDNQTALMMSIQRKRDRVEELETQLKQKSESGVADGIYNIAVELRVLRYEITEDEKLLPVDKSEMIAFAELCCDSAHDTGNWTDEELDRLYNKKYGSNETHNN